MTRDYWRRAWVRYADGDGGGPFLWLAILLLGLCVIYLYTLSERPLP